MTTQRFDPVKRCYVCDSEIGEEGESIEAIKYTSLPHPCCLVCFEVNGWRNNMSIGELRERSLATRKVNVTLLNNLGIRHATR